MTAALRALDPVARAAATRSQSVANRRDPEDGGLWQCLQKYARLEFASEADALAAARERVEWLRSR